MKNLDLLDRIIQSDPNKTYSFLVSKGFKIPFKYETTKSALAKFSSMNNDNKAEVLINLHPDYSLIKKCEKAVKSDKPLMSADGEPVTESNPLSLSKETVTNLLKGGAIVLGLVVLFKAMK